jgi:hypothetical protein
LLGSVQEVETMMESNLKTAKALELTIPQSLLQQVSKPGLGRSLVDVEEVRDD